MQRQGARCIIRDVLSPEQCAELTFIHRSLSAAGYSPHLWTSKLGDVAYSEPALLLPLVRARDKVALAAEAALGHQYELCIEFTGLVSWTAGASINWHHDSNRPYLEQRHATAVAYLNDPGDEFSGGILEFRDGQPQHVSPESGSVVAFLADEANTHRVTEVTEGERLTLTLWFTLRPEHSEDTRVLKQLRQAQGLEGRSRPHSIFQDCGHDIRVRRLQAAGIAVVQWPALDDDTPVTIRAAAAQHCGETTCYSPTKPDGVSTEGVSGLAFGSMQQAQLVVAYTQWRERVQRLPGCTHCLETLLSRHALGMESYLADLRAVIPAAVREWGSTGLLFDMTACA